MLLSFSADINFQPSTAPTYEGYLVDAGDTYADRGNGETYGWSTTMSGATDANSATSPDQRYDTSLAFSGTATWELALPDDTYQVRIVAGNAAAQNATYSIDVEGAPAVRGTPVTGSRWVEGTAVVMVADGKLTITSGAAASNNRIDFLQVRSESALIAVPNVPEGLSAQASSTTAIDLRWTDSGTDYENEESGYVLERATGIADDSSQWTAIGNLPSNSRYFWDSGLVAASTYSYRLKATNAMDESSWTDVVMATTPATSAQAAYMGKVLGPGDYIEAEDFDIGGQNVAFNESTAGNSGGWYRQGSVDIGVLDSVADPGGYKVMLTTSGEWLEYSVNVPESGNYKLQLRHATGGLLTTGFRLYVDGANVTPSNIATPSTGSYQTYQIVRSNSFSMNAGTRVLKLQFTGGPGEGGYPTTEIDWLRLVRVPDAPNPIVATASGTEVAVEWTAVPGADHYNVYRATGTDAIDFSTPYRTGLTETAFSESGLAANTTYRYAVRGDSDVGEGAASVEASATTASIVAVPAAPSFLSISSVTSSTAELNWQDNSDTESEFVIYQVTPGQWPTSFPTSTEVGGALAGATTATISGLEPDTDYTFVVTAANGAGESEASNAAGTFTLASGTTGASGSGQGLYLVTLGSVTANTSMTHSGQLVASGLWTMAANAQDAILKSVSGTITGHAAGTGWHGGHDVEFTFPQDTEKNAFKVGTVVPGTDANTYSGTISLEDLTGDPTYNDGDYNDRVWQISVKKLSVDLVIQDLPEDSETAPGAIVSVNGDEADGDVVRATMDLNIASLDNGTVTLTATSGAGLIRVWQGSNLIIGGDGDTQEQWVAGQQPDSVEVEMIGAGTADLELVAQPSLVLGAAVAKDAVKSNGIEITNKADTIWWMGGFDAKNYAESTQMEAKGVPSGAAVKWSVTKGQASIDLVGKKNKMADEFDEANLTTLDAKTTAARDNDAEIKVLVKGKPIKTIKLKLRWPSRAVVVNGYPQDTKLTNGHQTTYMMRVEDQTGTPVPNRLEFNESFGAVQNVIASNWPAPVATSTLTNNLGQQTPSYIKDQYGLDGTGNPQPVGPADPGAATLVQKVQQDYKVGTLRIGKGLLIKSHIIEFHLGYARQVLPG